MSIASEIERIQNAKFSIKTAIENKGVEVGDGTIDTYASKIDEITTGGGDSWYDTFWDNFQQNGNKTSYIYTFYGSGWNDITFKPKYDLKPTTVVAMFSSTSIKNMKKDLEDAGVVLDTSKCTNFNSFITTSAITHLPTISFEGLAVNGNTSNAFTSATQLQYIEKIISRKDIVWNNTCFQACTRLTTIGEIEGKIGTTLNMAQCSMLDSGTIQRIINALADLTGATAQTLTFHATVKANLSDEQIASITSKNWTLA